MAEDEKEKKESNEPKNIHHLTSGELGHPDCKKTGRCKDCKEYGCNICLNTIILYSAYTYGVSYCDICYSKRMKSN